MLHTIFIKATMPILAATFAVASNLASRPSRSRLLSFAVNADASLIPTIMLTGHTGELAVNPSSATFITATSRTSRTRLLLAHHRCNDLAPSSDFDAHNFVPRHVCVATADVVIALSSCRFHHGLRQPHTGTHKTRREAHDATTEAFRQVSPPVPEEKLSFASQAPRWLGTLLGLKFSSGVASRKGYHEPTYLYRSKVLQ